MKPLSPAQALLLLIEKYTSQASLLTRLKSLYVLGIRNPEELAEFNVFMSDPALSEYEISREYSVITEDPSKRYFESHLAFALLEITCAQLDAQKLQSICSALFKKLPQSDQHYIYELGSNRIKGKTRFEVESQDLWGRLANSDDSQLNLEERTKLTFLARSAYLAICLSQTQEEQLPLNIYRQGYFSDQERGLKSLNKEPSEGGAHTKGLIKKNMRLPRDDIAIASIPYAYLRSADGSTFIENAMWVQDNFARLTHPFSCSISGTMLCQLRLLKVLLEEERSLATTAAELQTYLVCLSSLILIHTGGHTFFEFLGPLHIPQVREAFAFMPGFDTLNFDAIMSDPAYQAAIDQSLVETMTYQKHLLNLDKLHTELEERSNSILDSSFFRKNSSEGSSSTVSARCTSTP